MHKEERVKVFKSDTVDYHRAFQVFLDHTDQKLKAKEWLERCIQKLPSRKLYIDAGAGNGKVTAWLTDAFERTIAIEPNESLRKELAAVCPKAETFPETILEAEIKSPGDFVLASHVLYYIDGALWLENLERLASWLAPSGRLVVIIQNHKTDCMQMLRHFFRHSFNLSDLAEQFKSKFGSRYHVAMETVPSYVTTKGKAVAYTVAEFMMNLLPMPEPPAREELEAYVVNKFTSNGGYQFSCHQDFLEITLK